MYFYDSNKWIHIRIWLNIGISFFSNRIVRFNDWNSIVWYTMIHWFSYRNMMHWSSLIRDTLSARLTEVLSISDYFTLNITRTGISKTGTQNNRVLWFYTQRKKRTRKKYSKNTQNRRCKNTLNQFHTGMIFIMMIKSIYILYLRIKSILFWDMWNPFFSEQILPASGWQTKISKILQSIYL